MNIFVGVSSVDFYVFRFRLISDVLRIQSDSMQCMGVSKIENILRLIWLYRRGRDCRGNAADDIEETLKMRSNSLLWDVDLAVALDWIERHLQHAGLK